MSEFDIEEEVKWSEKKRWTLFGLPWTFTTYSLTESKILIDSGIVVLRQEEILLYRVLDITMTMNLFQRMFKLGTIRIRSADQSTPYLELKNIPNTKKVKNLLSKYVEAAKDKKRVGSSELMGTVRDF